MKGAYRHNYVFHLTAVFARHRAVGNTRRIYRRPHDLVANFILHAVQNFSVSTQKFAAFYLLAHGIIKLWWLVHALVRAGCRRHRPHSSAPAATIAIAIAKNKSGDRAAPVATASRRPRPSRSAPCAARSPRSRVSRARVKQVKMVNQGQKTKSAASRSDRGPR
jgi:Predicted membrane protein (DUF2127)